MLSVCTAVDHQIDIINSKCGPSTGLNLLWPQIPPLSWCDKANCSSSVSCCERQQWSNENPANVPKHKGTFQPAAELSVSPLLSQIVCHHHQKRRIQGRAGQNGKLWLNFTRDLLSTDSKIFQDREGLARHRGNHCHVVTISGLSWAKNVMMTDSAGRVQSGSGWLESPRLTLSWTTLFIKSCSGESPHAERSAGYSH